MDRKRIILYSLAVTLLLVSTYVLALPLYTKLRFFCTLDSAHMIQPQPFPRDGYWIFPLTGLNLTTITIWEAIDGGMWLFYDPTRNIFWIGVQTGPMKGAFYGYYPGILWILTSFINPLALTGIALSMMILVYQPVRRLWIKTHIASATCEANEE